MEQRHVDPGTMDKFEEEKNKCDNGSVRSSIRWPCSSGKAVGSGMKSRLRYVADDKCRKCTNDVTVLERPA